MDFDLSKPLEEWTSEELETLLASKRAAEKAQQIEETKGRIGEVQESLRLLEEKRQLHLSELSNLEDQLAQLEGKQPSKRQRQRRRVGTHIRLPQVIASDLVPVPLPIRATVGGQSYEAQVTEDGQIMYQGKHFRSPSGAAKQIVKWKTVDGWGIWRYQDADGNWQPLYRLREQVYERQSVQQQD